MQNQKLYNFLELPNQKNCNNALLGIKLRKQFIVAQVIYLYNIWYAAKQPENITIGLIGCGQIGKLIINSLIPYSQKFHNLQMNNVHISTRRPEQLNYYVQKGYNTYFDNDKLMKTCNFVVIAIPPTVDNWNFLELNFNKSDQYRVSLVSTLNMKRLRQLSKVQEILNTQIINNLIDEAIKSYLELLQGSDTFQTEIQEDIIKLIIEESGKHFFYGQERFDEILQSLQSDNQTYKRIFGKTKEEYLEYPDKCWKTSYQKSALQYQNFMNQN